MLVSWRGSIVLEFGDIWLPGSDGEKIESFWIVLDLVSVSMIPKFGLSSDEFVLLTSPSTVKLTLTHQASPPVSTQQFL